MKNALLIVLACILWSCTNEEVPATIDVATDLPAQSLSNTSYGPGNQQIYDLYLPEARSRNKTKVLVLIHGGGWIDGDKRDMQEYIPFLQEKFPEHAILNMNYTLANPPETTAFPQQFEEIGLALTEISENIETLQVRAEFILIGVSAGAHLALYYDSVYDENDQVKGVCSIVGPTNLDDEFYQNHPEYSVAIPQLIDANAYPEADTLTQAVSPAYQVSTATSPTLMFYGNDDPLVPVTNATFMQERLEEFSVVNSLTIYNGGLGNWSNEDQLDLQSKLENFINIYLEVSE